MKNLIVRTFCILISFSATLVQDAAAQRRGKGDIVNAWARNLQIDGNLSDWDPELAHTYPAQSLEFDLRNDADYIYLAVRITDLDRQTQAFGQGLRFMVNTDGRKRDGQTIIFPIADRIAFRGIMSDGDGTPAEDFRKAALQAVRGIRVLRFDHLLDGMISLENQYGIVAAAAIDSMDALCVEMKVPIRLLNIAPGRLSREMAYNLRINGLMTSGGRSGGETASPANPVYPGYYPGYGYPYYGGMQHTGTRSRQESGVWSKFKLASAPAHD